MRVDSAVYQGYPIPPYYDSLIGKLIVHGRDARSECMMRLRRALDELVVDGIADHHPALPRPGQRARHRDGRYNIHWLEKQLDQVIPPDSATMTGRDDILLEITPQVLLKAYAGGIFPMAESPRTRALLDRAGARGILPLERLHVPAAAARGRSRRTPSRSAIDSEFGAVIAGCAAVSGGRAEDLDQRPHPPALQRAVRPRPLPHRRSVAERRLVGGLYGVRLGAAFFGESMFSRERDASKVALVHLVARLSAGGFRLLDTQFTTEHLKQFGAVDVDRRNYHRLLEDAIGRRADFTAATQGDRGGYAAGARGG